MHGFALLTCSRNAKARLVFITPIGSYLGRLSDYAGMRRNCVEGLGNVYCEQYLEYSVLEMYRDFNTSRVVRDF